MSTPEQLMDMSAALLNDSPKSIFTYAAQLPFLNMALKELQEIFELNDVPVTFATSAVIPVAIGATSITSPAGLVEIIELWERQTGTFDWFQMTKKEFLRPYANEQYSAFGVYTWNGQVIQFYPATRANDIKIDYKKAIFATITSSNQATELGIINSDSFLCNRTAALCAQFIGENKTRADELNGFASMALDRTTGISTKGKQNIATRHRPMYRRR